MHGEKFHSIYFVTKGRVNLVTADGLCFFDLAPGAVFGDYQVFFGLQSDV